MVLYASHYIEVLEGSNEQDTKLIFCFTDPVGLDLHFWGKNWAGRVHVINKAYYIAHGKYIYRAFGEFYLAV